MEAEEPKRRAKQEEDRKNEKKRVKRSRWVEWGQVAAVIVASLGLGATGFSGVLQYQATMDQLKQSEKARERDRKEQAALFDVSIDSAKRKVKVVFTNYSHRAARNAFALFQTPDRQEWLIGVPTVLPCTQKEIPMETLAKKYKSLGNTRGNWRFDGVLFQDWEGRRWYSQFGAGYGEISKKGSDFLKRYYGEDQGGNVDPVMIDMAAEDSHIPDC
ncbi:hypothetical protein ACFXPZ_25135 [Streptomyces sp. NPDC059101]